jgi:hypothetical protein
VPWRASSEGCRSRPAVRRTRAERCELASLIHGRARRSFGRFGQPVRGSSRARRCRRAELVGKRLVQAFVTLDNLPRSRGPRGPGKRRHRRGREAFLAACKLGWGRGGGGLPVPHNEAGPAKGDERDEQRGEVEFRVHLKTSLLAKVIINHVGSAPDRKCRLWICLKSQANAPRHWLNHSVNSLSLCHSTIIKRVRSVISV